MTPYRAGLQGKPFTKDLGDKRSAAYTAWKAGRDDAAKDASREAWKIVREALDKAGMTISFEGDALVACDGEHFYTLSMKVETI